MLQSGVQETHLRVGIAVSNIESKCILLQETLTVSGTHPLFVLLITVVQYYTDSIQ